MMLTMVVVVLVVAGTAYGHQPDILHPSFTPIPENCSQSLVELLLLRQEVYLSRLIDTEIAMSATMTGLAHTVTELKDAVLAQQQIQKTLREECQSPWVVVGDNCLLFALGERLTWAAASQYCTSRGGHLATFSDANTLAEFVDFLNFINSENVAVDAWVGGGDEAVEGMYMWVTGEPMPKGAPFWGSTNNYTPEPTGNRGENCVCLYRPDRYYMHDIACGHKAAPFCQKSM